MTAATTPMRHTALQTRMSAELIWRLSQYTQRLGWDAGQLAAHQRDRLRVLLEHAAEHSPFHARRLRGLHPERLELTDLVRLPVMTKSQMMASFDDVVTDRGLSRRLVERHLAASAQEPGLLLDQYVCLASGGSSGLRGVFVQTLGEYADFVASLVRPRWARALAAGGPPPGGLVLGIVAAASPVHSSGFGAAVAAAPPVTLIPAPATLPLPETVARLNAAQPPALLGYASKLAELAGEQLAGRLRITPRSVTSIAELLTPADRAVIERAFAVPVIDAFVSTEGLVGQSEPGGSVLRFASDMCLAELAVHGFHRRAALLRAGPGGRRAHLRVRRPGQRTVPRPARGAPGPAPPALPRLRTAGYRLPRRPDLRRADPFRADRVHRPGLLARRPGPAHRRRRPCQPATHGRRRRHGHRRRHRARRTAARRGPDRGRDRPLPGKAQAASRLRAAAKHPRRQSLGGARRRPRRRATVPGRSRWP
jgi:hypothetical protein